jgi:hypothetical protein
MPRWTLVLLVITLFALHQDVWFWRQARPLIFGFMPVGLFSHVCYTMAVSLSLWLLVRYAWPHHLDEEKVSESQGPRVQGSKSAKMAGAPETLRTVRPCDLRP